MATIKVRVNPNDHEGFQVKHPTVGWLRWDSTVGDGIDNWQEFELEVPKPTRVFKAGDMYRIRRSHQIIVRGDRDIWISGSLPVHDFDRYVTDESVYEYIGNIHNIGDVDL